MTNRCSMTGLPIDGSADAIWDDGEWISWDWINNELYQQELEERYPNTDPELIRIFEELVLVAIDYREVTGRHLPVYGELGELFAEINFGIKRHKPRTPGSDGRLGNDFIEIKTITPEKTNEKIFVKRKGNFNKLLVIKISEEFEFEARMIDRSEISKGSGKLAKVSWSAMKALNKKNRTDA